MGLRGRGPALKLLICGTKEQSIGMAAGRGGSRGGRVVFRGQSRAAGERPAAGRGGPQERATQRRRGPVPAFPRRPLRAARRALRVERAAGARGAEAQGRSRRAAAAGAGRAADAVSGRRPGGARRSAARGPRARRPRLLRARRRHARRRLPRRVDQVRRCDAGLHAARRAPDARRRLGAPGSGGAADRQRRPRREAGRGGRGPAGAAALGRSARA